MLADAVCDICEYGAERMSRHHQGHVGNMASAPETPPEALEMQVRAKRHTGFVEAKEAWEDLIEGFGFQGEGIRKEIMAEFLLANDFLNWRQTQHAVDPAAWTGAK
eukprot:3636479-Karenia_brevis.AAC.1